MPRLKSAIRRVRTSERNRLHNLVYKTQIKTLLKKVHDHTSSNDYKSAVQAASKAFALIDRATSKRILHINNAARKKSKISKWLKTLEVPAKSKSKP